MSTSITRTKLLSLLEDIADLQIISGQEASLLYGTDTFYNNRSVDIAVQPESEESIPAIISLANQYLFNLFPVSSNRNWGYGAFYFEENCQRLNVILDLSQLKKIVGVDKDLGLVTLGAGVTQQELYDFLTENGWEYIVPVTGGGPGCSLVGNAMDRGYGITPHSDHFYACNSLKGFLPHPDLCGQQYCSAISAMDQSVDDMVDKTYKWGVGPYIDGLFTQSNLGIVTEMTIRLAVKPVHHCAFYIQIEDESKFELGVLFTRDILRKYTGFVGGINLMDKRRLISITGENPNLTDASKILDATQITSIALEKRLPEWMVVGCIYGSKELVALIQKEIKGRAKEMGKVIFSDSPAIKLARSILKWPVFNFGKLKQIRQQLQSMQDGLDVMLGKPNQVALPLPYWTNPHTTADKSRELRPDRDKCGLLWYAPLVRMNPVEMRKLIDFARPIMEKYSIDPFITFTNLRHDCVDATIPIVFDRENEGSRTAAIECLKELINSGLPKGFVPYRLPVMMQQELDKDHIFWQTTSVLKGALDPNRILAPGRYNP